jgi:D-alanyl-D-alanine carboxypeptidase (penicillin-binding protein 5/6)
MLLPSANNIAQTLAVWAFGSMDNYVNYANKLAETDHLTATHVVDSSGFLPQTVSNPHDMVLLGELALQNPVFTQIVSQPQATIPVAGIVKNVNWLLGKDGIEGIKTGNTDQAGGCYVFSAPQTISGHLVTIVGVVMGASNLTNAINDAIPLLDSAKPYLKTMTVITAGQVIGKYTTPWGTSVNAITSHDVSMLSWDGLSLKPTIKLNNVQAPYAAGSTVGSLNLTVGNTTSQVSLILQDKISRPSLSWSLLHVREDLSTAY